MVQNIDKMQRSTNSLFLSIIIIIIIIIYHRCAVWSVSL